MFCSSIWSMANLLRKVLALLKVQAPQVCRMSQRPQALSSESLMMCSLLQLKMQCRMRLVLISRVRYCCQISQAALLQDSWLESNSGTMMSFLRALLRCFWQLWKGELATFSIFFFLSVFKLRPLFLYQIVEEGVSSGRMGSYWAGQAGDGASCSKSKNCQTYLMESSHSRKDLKSHVAGCPSRASPGEGEFRKMLSRLDELKD